MKKKSLLKDIFREIIKTFTRFLSITVMIMLGVFVLIGLKVTGPMMRENATTHTNVQNMYDIKVEGPVGIDENDISEIKKVDEIATIYSGKSTDLNWTDKKINIKIESYSKDISTPEIVEGRRPEKMGEILIENLANLSDVKIGDVIEFAKESDKFKDEDDPYNLKTYKFKVVGKAVSTDYIMQGIKGMSITSGTTIDTVGYITDDNFQMEDYSFVKLRFTDLISKDPESSSYKKYVNLKKNDIKDFLEPRAEIKFEDLKRDNNKKIRDGEDDINDAKKQISDAENEFQKAKVKLEDVKNKLDDAKIRINNGRRELKDNEADARKKIADAKEKIEDGKIKIKEAKAELEKHEKEYKDGLIEYEDGVRKYNEAFDEIEQNERRVNIGMKEVENGEVSAASGLQTAREGLGKIESAISEIDSGISRLESSKAQMPSEAQAQISGQIAALEGQKSELLGKKSEAEAGISSASAGLSQAASAKSTLSSKKNLIEEAKDELAENKIKLAEAKLELEDARKKLDEAKRTLKKEEKYLLDGEKELKDAEAKLESELKKGYAKINKAQRDYNDGEKEYIDGKKEYDEKLADFNEKKKDALIDIEDGEKKIKDAKEILSNLSKPRFVVSTRKDNDSLYFLYESSHNLDIVSWIFPLFFFFIAILVSVATMTRMVEEDRIEIGTYKALGYSRFDIYMKYILYGLVSSTIGGILGATLGSTILPKAIYKAYSASYVIKDLNAIPNVWINIVAILFGILSNVLTIYFVITRTLRENAASLLRPKAPKSVKKILIERISIIWNKIKFINKVTLRNVFRYKARMFMTIFGVAGCAGLVFLGFSLREAISGIEQKQFLDIYKYEITITTDKTLSKDGLKELNEFLKTDKVEDYTDIRIEQFVLENEDGRDQSITLMVPKDANRFEEFVNLKHEKMIMPTQKINLEKPVINHKLTKYINRKEMTIRDYNLKYFKVPIEEENTADFYIGHMLFMNSADYEKVFNKDFETNAHIVKLKQGENANEIIEHLRTNPSVLTVSNFDDNLKIIENWTGSIGIITIVILICSAALAFVVLYNLTNINISERMRELSTIKVLGFTTEELTSYIYRETIVLSLIGILVGFGVGWTLLGIVSEVLSPDNIQMNLLLTYKPYLFSAIITMAFVMIIRRIVITKLKNIDMVSSLKSYE